MGGLVRSLQRSPEIISCQRLLVRFLVRFTLLLFLCPVLLSFDFGMCLFVCFFFVRLFFFCSFVRFCRFVFPSAFRYLDICVVIVYLFVC